MESLGPRDKYFAFEGRLRGVNGWALGDSLEKLLCKWGFLAYFPRPELLAGRIKALGGEEGHAHSSTRTPILRTHTLALIILLVHLSASSFVPGSSAGISRPFWWPVMDGLMFQPSLVAGLGGGKQVMDQPEDGILEGKFKLYFRIISCHPAPTPHPICNLTQEVLAGGN